MELISFCLSVRFLQPYGRAIWDTSGVRRTLERATWRSGASGILLGVRVIGSYGSLERVCSPGRASSTLCSKQSCVLAARCCTARACVWGG